MNFLVIKFVSSHFDNYHELSQPRHLLKLPHETPYSNLISFSMIPTSLPFDKLRTVSHKKLHRLPRKTCGMRALISLQGSPELRTHITSKPRWDAPHAGSTLRQGMYNCRSCCYCPPNFVKLAIISANGCAGPLAWIPLFGSRWLGGCAVPTYIIAGEVAEIFCRRCNRSSNTVHLNRTPEYSVHCSKTISKNGPRETQFISYGAECFGVRNGITGGFDYPAMLHCLRSPSVGYPCLVAIVVPVNKHVPVRIRFRIG
jgi:hypothetical protein